jgi:APA family basic amino acid/polyamine antiporter
MNNSSTSKIGLATATIIGMNAMIGSGIFTAPAAMASYVGPAGIIAYLLVVIAVWFIAQSLARLAALFPAEGSFYTYTKQWGGHRIGLIAGLLYFIGLIIAMGLLTRVAGSYLHSSFSHIPAQTWSLGTLGLLILLNLFGVTLSEIGQHLLICSTVFPLIVITALCFTRINVQHLTPFAPFGIANVFKATRIVIFGFFGFECAASLFAIVKDPARNVPRALTYSIAIVGVLYTFFVSALILATPRNYFNNPLTPLTDTLALIFPDQQWILTIVKIAILSAIIGTIHSMIWSSSALLISLTKHMSFRSSRLFTQLSSINQQRLAVILVGSGILISALALTNIELFFSFTAAFIVAAYILSMITLLTSRDEWKSGQNIKTVCGIITACGILFFALESLVKEITKLI